MPAPLSHKFSMTSPDARAGEYVLAVVHFDRVIALIASRGAADPEGQAEALIKARSNQYPDAYEIKRVEVSDITIREQVTHTYVAEVRARSEADARAKLGFADVPIREVT